jgi:uncharacterized protein YdeI (YjbR/CyaY-like superfamily)
MPSSPFGDSLLDPRNGACHGLSGSQTRTRGEVCTRDEWRAWLVVHHAQDAGVWLVTYRKHTGAEYITRDVVLDELMCFGWIEGVARKLDDDRKMQLIPRRRTDSWTA